MPDCVVNVFKWTHQAFVVAHEPAVFFCTERSLKQGTQQSIFFVIRNNTIKNLKITEPGHTTQENIYRNLNIKIWSLHCEYVSKITIMCQKGSERVCNGYKSIHNDVSTLTGSTVGSYADFCKHMKPDDSTVK